MTVNTLISHLENNFEGEEEVKIINSENNTVDFGAQHIIYVKCSSADYCLVTQE